MSTGLMARPKKSASAPEPKTIAMRTSGEYAAWVERLAKHNRSTVAGLLDQALVDYAKSVGFTEEPPER